MIVKVPIYVELIGKVQTDYLDNIVDELKNEFYLIIRKRKLKMKFEALDDDLVFSDAGVDDVRVLSVEEALETLRKKK